MAEHDRRLRASERLAAALGLPAPRPLTPEEEADHERWMREGDAQVEAILARRAANAA